MRICLYTETALPKTGGQELVVDALARQFAELGHEPVVIAQQPRRPFVPKDNELPYEVVRQPRFISTRHFVGWYRYWFARQHRRAPFDIVHCHSVHPCGYVAALCRDPNDRRMIDAPLVITSHGGDVREDNPRFAKPGLRRRHELAVARADALISISQFTTDGFRRLGAETSKIVPIPNGVDLPKFRRRAPRPAELSAAVHPKGYALFLGRLNRRKGVDVLLAAQARLAPSQRLPLVIAGDGEERAALEAAAQSLGIASSTSFVGRVAGDAKTYLLQNARAAVMPSRDWEAFPLVVLEAFAAGAAVVGTRIPGLADLIDHGTTGLVCDAESPESLAAALRHVADRPDHMRACGEAAADRASHYDWRSIAGRHLDLFQRLRGVRTLERAA